LVGPITETVFEPMLVTYRSWFTGSKATPRWSKPTPTAGSAVRTVPLVAAGRGRRDLWE
jgi:hypothetical protein